MASRRSVLTAGAAGAGLAAIGFGDTALRITNAAAAPRALVPEARIDQLTGAVTPNHDQFIAHVACPGCGVQCGVRLRVERDTGTVLRITGNPYHPLVADPPLPASAPLHTAIAALSHASNGGPQPRVPLCPHGCVPPPLSEAPRRLLTPQKRVGRRGGGAWQAIAPEQLVHEVTAGGDLFGEGKTEGLLALRSGTPDRLVGLLTGCENGRTFLARQFFQAACGGAPIAVQQATLPCPDLRDVVFLLVFGATLPGPPRLTRQLVERRATGQLVTVLADPVLGPGDNVVLGPQSRWLPIRPGSEGILARALIGRMLGRPDPAAAAICGVPEPDIASLARDFAGHGRRAACVAAGPLGSDTAVALHTLNALAGHPAPPPPAELPADGLKALFLWGCDPAPPVAVPLVVAASPFLDESVRHADYVVPDTLAFESWGWQAGPGRGLTTSWPLTAPPAGSPAPLGMERFLILCARAMDLPGFGPGTPDDAAGYVLRAIADLATAAPAVPDITDEDFILAGLDRIGPALVAALDKHSWRKVAFVLARGGIFPDPDETAPVNPPPGLASVAPAPSPGAPFLLAVRAPLLPGGVMPVDSVALHAEDAAALGLRDGDAVTVETPAGQHAGRLKLRTGVMRGVIVVIRDPRDHGLHDGLPASLRRS